MEKQTNVLDEQIAKIENEIKENKIEIADLFIATRKVATLENISNPKKFSDALELTSKIQDSLASLEIKEGKLETLLLCKTQLENVAAVA